MTAKIEWLAALNTTQKYALAKKRKTIDRHLKLIKGHFGNNFIEINLQKFIESKIFKFQQSIDNKSELQK